MRKMSFVRNLIEMNTCKEANQETDLAESLFLSLAEHVSPVVMTPGEEESEFGPEPEPQPLLIQELQILQKLSADKT